MSDSDQVNLGFEIEVVHGDALEFEADVLAVKYSPRSGGLDARIRSGLGKAGHDEARQPLSVGAYQLWPGKNITHTGQILIVGAPSIFDLHYVQLRELGRHFLVSLWEAGSDVEHLSMTVHGVQTAVALDEVEAFRSLLLGMADAYEAGQYPPTLHRITFVEYNLSRATLLRGALNRFLPAREAPEDHELSPDGEQMLKETAEEMRNVMAGPESFEPEFRQPEADETTPHVFVAMPFKDDYDDQFYLAIQPSVKAQGLLCERMDLDTFTGDIMDRMFARIRSAELVIALLDGGNPNVYLEVGYAWGVNTETVLLAHKEEPLPFDVRGHRVLIYDKIYLLKQMLEEELQRLLG